MPLSPSIVNLSGSDDGGFHVYWLLDAPVQVTEPPTRDRLRAISKGWQAKLRSMLHPHRLDSTFDLVRVLRISGCINHKYASAVTRPILFEECRYGPEEFAKHVDLGRPRKIPPAPPTDVTDALRVARCKEYLRRVPNAISGHHGHDRTFRAACECARFGLSVDEARRVLEWFNEAKTPPDDKWTAKELAHKLHDAYLAVQQTGQYGCRLGQDRRSRP
jgi:hypothetical protein